MNTTRTCAAVALTGLAAALLSACSSTTIESPMTGMHTPMAHSMPMTAPSGSVVPTAAFNYADVAFATMMYPHHAQAIHMADMVDGKGARAEVVALAAEIKAAQQPEMDALTRLLAQWGKPAPMTSMPGMMHSMDGMLTTEQITRLGSLRGTAFDREWLTLMIAHHRGAIAMAETELASGVNPETRTTATAVKSGQQAEIEKMEQLLK